MATAQIRFTDNLDGTMAIHAAHDGDFDPLQQSHASLRAVVQFLPQVLAPAGTAIDGDLGTRLPISDADRYRALRAMGLLEEDQALAIAALIEQDAPPPNTEAEYDTLVDKLVAIVRGMPLEGMGDGDDGDGDDDDHDDADDKAQGSAGADAPQRLH